MKDRYLLSEASREREAWMASFVKTTPLLVFPAQYIHIVQAACFGSWCLQQKRGVAFE